MDLSRSKIKEEIVKGNIIADGVEDFQISEHTIDVSLYKDAWIFTDNGFQLIDLTQGVKMNTNDFVLGIIDEWVGTKAG